MRVTLLGTGTSHGVPMIGCDCGVCRSSDPRDRRTRTSILIELGSAEVAPPVSGPIAILVDTSTDLRVQALTHNIRRIDAILFTHSHADHVLGLDDVRRFNMLQRVSIPAYGDERTVADVRHMFSYIFRTPPPHGGGVPQLSLFSVLGPFSIGGAEIVPVPLLHGDRLILGFRIGSFAYLTDCSRIPDQAWPLLDGVDTLVLDALRHRPHPTHFTVAEALEVVDRLKPSRTWFTHICHDLAHAATCARLPRSVELAYDGLVLDLGV